MTGVKRLIGVALLVALAAAGWFLTRPVEATHLLISNALAERHEHGTVVTLKVENSGGPDRLIAVEAPAADAARIVSTEGRMSLPIPAGGAPVLSEDGAYIELQGMENAAEGQLIPLTLTFERAGQVTTQARMQAPMQAMSGMAGHTMHAAPHKVPKGAAAPQVSLSITPDGEGWAVRVETTDFTFNEDMADGPHVPGVGHAHLYLDGIKLGRLYHRDARIGALLPGRYVVRVTLNTNDHRVYVLGDRPISATAEIVAR